MLNRRMNTNKFTRHRDFSIRTYHVVPLEELGGLIEWVPHMKTLHDCVSNCCTNLDEYRKWTDHIRKVGFALLI